MMVSFRNFQRIHVDRFAVAREKRRFAVAAESFMRTTL